MKINVNGYDLDEEQLKPVVEQEKYSLIIAGAGSGKTLTLIGKIKYLLEHDLYKPEEICCISFTNEAVNNLNKNILKNCHVSVPTFTFHKLALTILKEHQESFQVAASTLLEDTILEFFETKCFGNQNLQKIVFQIFGIYFFCNEKKWNQILVSKELKSLRKTILTFINLMKSNGEEKDAFLKFFQKKKHKKLLLLIYAIYTIYETEKSSSLKIDFDDMINLATKKVREHGLHSPFRFLIIDEFQDTSLVRFSLIQEIVKQNDASLCVVGDDYQSIYHFSGCDLYLFLHFQNYYPSAKIYKLEKTYRNSNELVETAGTFIQKNKAQVKKKLVSPKHLEKPIIITYFSQKTTILEKVIEMISEEKEILIIGRNNFDIKNYTKNLEYVVKENHYLEFFKWKNRKIRYLTIHTSKGLESDVVILLNVENSLYGIPTKLKEEKILSLVNNILPFPYEEERRLFYVALTRTKNEIYLLTPKQNPSIFIKEIRKDKNVLEISMT